MLDRMEDREREDSLERGVRREGLEREEQLVLLVYLECRAQLELLEI